MLAMVLLIPLTMIVLGRAFIKKPPRRINNIFGYRTVMSMINMETWEYAHKCCGRFWWKAGWILLILSLAVMTPAVGQSDGIVGLIGILLEAIQLIIMLSSVFFTERRLKKYFDEKGRSRNFH